MTLSGCSLCCEGLPAVSRVTCSKGSVAVMHGFAAACASPLCSFPGTLPRSGKMYRLDCPQCISLHRCLQIKVSVEVSAPFLVCRLSSANCIGELQSTRLLAACLASLRTPVTLMTQSPLPLSRLFMKPLMSQRRFQQHQGQPPRQLSVVLPLLLILPAAQRASTALT